MNPCAGAPASSFACTWPRQVLIGSMSPCTLTLALDAMFTISFVSTSSPHPQHYHRHQLRRLQPCMSKARRVTANNDKNSSGDEIANVNFFYNIAHVASAYAH